MITKYGTACGVWGDIIVGLGYFKNIIGKGEILYLGNNKQVVDYLKCQPFITDVRQLAVPEEEWKKYWIYTVFKYTIEHDPNYTAQPRDPFLLAGYKENMFEVTHLHYDLAKPDQPIYQWEGDNLPDYAEEWAAEFRKTLPENFYLFQPYSFNSNRPSDHWPHWDALAAHINTYTNKNLVLIGHEWLDGIHKYSRNMNSPKIINLYNQIPSMLHIFALAKYATGVITTSNSLGHWCQIANIPCVIICNTKSSRPHYIYRRVLEWPTITCVHHDKSLNDAFNAIGETLFSRESWI
jgi:ADP-heptose:LPS heptosyltransferase